MDHSTKGDSFQQALHRGRTTAEIGVYTPWPKINGYTHGLIPGRYWLIGADSGAGKTTMADELIMSVIRDCITKNRKINVFYYTFEISINAKKAKWVCSEIFRQTGEMMPSDYIMGYIKDKKPTEEHNELVDRIYTEMQPIFDRIIFIEDPVHPTKIYEDLLEHHFSKIGILKREENKEGRKGRILSYTPNDPDELTLAAIDHMAQLGHESGLDTKGLMDRCSSYMVTLKNITGLIPIIVQQFSTDLQSTLRNNRKDPNYLTPQRIDFGDSKYTYRDADVVIGLVQPVKYDVLNFRGFDCSPDGLGDNLVIWTLMKNRYGPWGKWFPMWMNGMTSNFYFMQYGPENPMAWAEYIEMTRQFRSICQLYSQPKS